MLIGAHIKHYNSFDKLIDICLSLNINVLQIFISNPLNRYFKKRSDYEYYNFRDMLKKHDIITYFHSSYICNLANKFSPNNWAVKLIIAEITVGEMIDYKGSVIHVGKYKNLSISDAIYNMKQSIDYILDNTKFGKIIIETSSGQGTELFTNPTDIVYFIKSFDKDKQERLGLCVDTCHIFAAGHKLTHSIFSLPFISLIQLNNSKTPFKSLIDRHENIEDGYIKPKILLNIVETYGKSIPIVLETPNIQKDINYIFGELSK